MTDTLANVRSSFAPTAGPASGGQSTAVAPVTAPTGAPESLADQEQLLRTFKAQSQLLHRLESAGLLDGEGTSLVTPVDEAIAYLEGVLEGATI